jgi:hypothetical protein
LTAIPAALLAPNAVGEFLFLGHIYYGRTGRFWQRIERECCGNLEIPGLVAYVILYFKVFAMLREVWNQVEEGSVEQVEVLPDSIQPAPTSTRLLVAGLAGGLLAHLLFGLADVVALGAKPGILFWMILGIVVSLYHQKQTSVQSS